MKTRTDQNSSWEEPLDWTKTELLKAIKDQYKPVALDLNIYMHFVSVSAVQ